MNKREAFLERERLRDKTRYWKDPKGWYQKKKFINWKALLKKKFNLTVEEYLDMVKRQKNLCAICGKRERSYYGNTRKRLAVDHSHKTGKIRGLLCTKCNTALGQFNDNKKLFLKAIDYLRKYE